MKALIVHNNYGKYSGEEAVVDKMASTLSTHGHKVCFYRKTSEGQRESLSGKVKGFLSGIHSTSGVKGLRNALKHKQPDVVNVHNLYPFISPAALFECKKAGIPVIMTVHNFRLICPTGLFMRNGKACEVCLEKGNEWNCMKFNCEQSISRSVGYTLRNTYARWTKAYKLNIDYFACITHFQKEKLVAAGYDADKIVVIPNSIEAPNAISASEKGEYVAYIGRLSYEKGYDLLIEVAHRNPTIIFCFAGAERTQTQANIPHNVRFMGYLNKTELNEFIKSARFVVMPSRCYEGFPMAILEAACFGKPTIGPNHGGFTEIIESGENAIGRLFTPGDLDDLEKQVLELWNNPALTESLGLKAYSKLKKEYDSEVIYQKWEKLFQKTISNSSFYTKK